MEITLRDIIKIIKKNVLFIVTISILFAALSFLVTTVFVQKTYTSNLKLYVETKYKTSTAAEDYQSVNYAKNLVPTYIELLDSSTFYSEVAKNLNEEYTISQLKTMIKFERIDNTEVFKAIIVSSNPYEAKNIGDAVAQAAPIAIENVNDNATLKIVDEATVPKKPTSPNTLKIVSIAFLCGLMISCAISFAFELLDERINYENDMTSIFEVPILAVIPETEKNGKNNFRNSEKNLNCKIHEAYKVARTNIDYSVKKDGCKKIAFLSSKNDENKTETAVNTALELAQQINKKVLIVECNLRCPELGNVLKLKNARGITNYLNEQCSLDEIIQNTKNENLKAITCGTLPKNPSELLMSDKMFEFIDKVEEWYDYIIFDTPPIGVVIDAMPILKKMDGVIIVAKNQFTTYPEVEKTIAAINGTRTQILGMVVNGIKNVKS